MAMRSPVDEQLRPITFKEYRALPGDGPRFELIYGELFMSPAPMQIHQYVTGELFAALRDHVNAARRGLVGVAPFDVKLSGYTAVQPDILYFSVANRGALGKHFAVKAPDLVVEVLSPSNRRMDLIVKRALYATFGVPEYWIVDPEKRTISVNLLRGAHYADTTFTQGPIVSPALPGLAIDFDAIFAMPEWTFGLMSASEDDDNDEE